MRHIFLGIFFAFFSSSAFAEKAEFACIAPYAKKETLIPVVQRRYSDISGFTAKFDQDSFMAAMEVSERSSGTVWFQRPGLMKWVYKQPEPQVFLIRNETMWFYQERERQVLVDNFSNVVVSDLPVSFLFGLGDLEKSFDVQDACSTKSGIRLVLTPKTNKTSDADALREFHLLVQKDGTPIGAKIQDVGGNTTTISFSDLQLGTKLDESTFVADFPKGVDINDRRKENAKAAG